LRWARGTAKTTVYRPAPWAYPSRWSRRASQSGRPSGVCGSRGASTATWRWAGC
jgi:hypothetical protein